MGSFLAYYNGLHNGLVTALALLTTFFLQILSNLANDYGDFEKGTDNNERIGPLRAMQSGAITKPQMQKAIGVFIVLSLLSGISLIFIALQNTSIITPLFFLSLGLVSIAAAIKYTVGKNPYGYSGMGDISVFLFFGILGVGGTYYLHTQTLNWLILLPASTLGMFSAGVLNLNNMRDRVPDAKVGKNTLAVKLGFIGAKYYHGLLIIGGYLATIFFLLLQVNFNYTHWIFLITLPLFIMNLLKVHQIEEAKNFDPLLKQLALSTTLFVILFGIGLNL
ncbi:UNVERIFIED_CONTAM: hypothetical protein GTU68_023214 [Idotea baltica]|nr:hypothetical protein [Idotea baltica]